MTCPASLRAALALLLLSLAAYGCGGGPASGAGVPAESATTAANRSPRAEPWPEASRQFRSQGDWLGADSAYSVDLGAGRVLWLFGDTFIDPTRDGSRTNGPNVFVRNTIGLQTARAPDAAYDLARSQLRFYARGAADQPSSYFPEQPDGSWHWPLHGVRLSDGALLLFRMQVASAPGGLGFSVVGWDAVAIDHPDADPTSWTPRAVAPPERADVLVGVSVLVHEDHLYAFSVQNDDRDHAGFVARFALSELSGAREGALDDPEWFTASGRFERASAGARPAVVLPDAQTEFSVHYDARRREFIQLQMRGLFMSEPNTALAMRTAPRPEGPWSPLTVLYRPEPPAAVADATKLVTYAAKAHPEQRGPGVVVTYVINQLEALAPTDAVYYPEVLRLSL